MGRTTTTPANCARRETYSEPLYSKRPLRHDLREVQNTQYNVRRFLSNLAFLILDEAHTCGGALGTHCLYLLHRLQQKRRELVTQIAYLIMPRPLGMRVYGQQRCWRPALGTPGDGLRKVSPEMKPAAPSDGAAGWSSSVGDMAMVARR